MWLTWFLPLTPVEELDGLEISPVSVVVDRGRFRIDKPKDLVVMKPIPAGLLKMLYVSDEVTPNAPPAPIERLPASRVFNRSGICPNPAAANPSVPKVTIKILLLIN